MTNKEIITQALASSKQARLEMEISGLQLEEAIAALEKDIREKRKYFVKQKIAK